MLPCIGDMVLDPFCGSDTTVITTIRHDHNKIDIEIDPEYCRIATEYLKAEGSDLFYDSTLLFEYGPNTRNYVLREVKE